MCHAPWASTSPSGVRSRACVGAGDSQGTGHGGGGGGSGDEEEGQRGRGLAVRLLLLAQDAVEDTAAWEAVLRSSSSSSSSSSSCSCSSLSSVSSSQASRVLPPSAHPSRQGCLCPRGGSAPPRCCSGGCGVHWGGQRVRVAQEALLLLKALLTGREDMGECGAWMGVKVGESRKVDHMCVHASTLFTPLPPTHTPPSGHAALGDLCADPETRALVYCATSALSAVREQTALFAPPRGMGRGTMRANRMMSLCLGPPSGDTAKGAAGSCEDPGGGRSIQQGLDDLVLSPWAQNMAIRLADAVTGAAGGAVKMTGGSTGTSPEGLILSLNTSVARRVQMRLLQMQQQQQQHEMWERAGGEEERG